MITPEEWRLALTNANGFIDWMLDKASHEVSSRATPIPEPRREMLAALALHGQSFGFTWDDVDVLLTAIDAIEENDPMDPLIYKLKNITDRIAALLPPREQIQTTPPESNP